jgi:hypothetical protein
MVSFGHHHASRLLLSQLTLAGSWWSKNKDSPVSIGTKN